MCKSSSTGSDSVRNRTYKKVTAYLVLQCVLLLEAIILLHIEQKTKADMHENSEERFAAQNKSLRHEIDNLVKQVHELENTNNKTIQQNHQLEEVEKALRKMDGWRCHQSNFYYVSSEMKNWTESKQDCEKRGATLMIINSKEEHEFYKSDAEVWIGLTDNNNKGSWKWIDGNKLATGFSSWKPEEPKEGNCAVLHSSQLDAFPCSDTFKWICEKK